jgi:hypothetical protein
MHGSDNTGIYCGWQPEAALSHPLIAQALAICCFSG